MPLSHPFVADEERPRRDAGEADMVAAHRRLLRQADGRQGENRQGDDFPNDFSSAAEKWPWPIRLAGTITTPSKKAMPRLRGPTVISFVSVNFRWPCQAPVMQAFVRSNRPIVTAGTGRAVI